MMVWTSQNDLSFGLYTMLFIFYRVSTLEMEYNLKRVSSNSGVLLKNTGNKVQLK